MKTKPLASIITAGCSAFGKREGYFTREIFAEAVSEAYGRCQNLEPKKHITAVFVSNANGNPEKQSHLAALLPDIAGLSPIPSIRTENACASGSSALQSAVMSIMAGVYDVVLVAGAEKMTTDTSRAALDSGNMASDFPMEAWNGLGLTPIFALFAVAYMHKYGSREEDFARIAVKNRKNGALNPKASISKEITLEEIMTSRMLSYPIKLAESTGWADGASCVVVTRPELAGYFTDKPVDILGFGFCTDTLGPYERNDFLTYAAPTAAAQRAFKMAGLTSKDIDIAEIHDCFSFSEVIGYEAMGFCEQGEAIPFFNSGVTMPEGRMPVNTSGGLLSKGHPIGATGIAQVYELFLQLTGQAGARQVADAEIGLNYNIGGVLTSSAVGIFRRR